MASLETLMSYFVSMLLQNGMECRASKSHLGNLTIVQDQCTNKPAIGAIGVILCPEDCAS